MAVIQNKDGGDFDGWCWPGSSSYLDYTTEKVRDWWAMQVSPRPPPPRTHTHTHTHTHTYRCRLACNLAPRPPSCPVHSRPLQSAHSCDSVQFDYDKYVGSTPDLYTWNDMNVRPNRPPQPCVLLPTAASIVCLLRVL